MEGQLCLLGGGNQSGGCTCAPELCVHILKHRERKYHFSAIHIIPIWILYGFRENMGSNLVRFLEGLI